MGEEDPVHGLGAPGLQEGQGVAGRGADVGLEPASAVAARRAGRPPQLHPQHPVGGEQLARVVDREDRQGAPPGSPLLLEVGAPHAASRAPGPRSCRPGFTGGQGLGYPRPLMNPTRLPPFFRASCLGLSLAAGCAAVPGPVTDELPVKVETVDDHTNAAADRNRQERENKELSAYRAEQKRLEEEQAEARSRAEAAAVKVTRLDELRKQKEADEARARAEAAERERAAAEAQQRVARARESVSGSKPAPGRAAVDPAARLAQRRADPRWTRPGFSGLLCAARADRDRAAGRLAAEKKKGKKADRTRLTDAQRRVEEAEARAQKARAELGKLGLAPLGCKDPRAAEVAACFRATDAGKPCKKGMRYVEVVKSFPGG